MSEADPLAVRQYLLRRQMEPEIIEWKYFDSCFNRSRERGLVWVQENQVAGFLGLIPFRVEQGQVQADCAWSCDWSVDPVQGAGMGLLLVKQARGLYDGIFNLGGNENTRQIFPRLADRTVPDAGISLVLPLRLGSILPRLPGRVKRLLSRHESLQRIPLRWVRAAAGTSITIVPELSPPVLSLADDMPRAEWRPLYDSGFLDWQFRRCPAITSWSCWAASESPPRTVALLWSHRSSKKFWRFAFCGDTNDSEKLEAIIAAIVSFVYNQGCIALLTIASQRQRALLKLLRRRGFLRRGRLPFYALRGRSAELPTDEFSVLSYFDADLAYRFAPNRFPAES